MPKKSAGLLLYRFDTEPEFFLVHPGGPFWAKKDEGAWSIPKGEFDENESPLNAAIREFKEETGFEVSGPFISLTPVKLSSSKVIYAFTLEYNVDASQLKSNIFTMEWPPKTGLQKEFPEIDRGGWFNVDLSRIKLNKGQLPILEEAVGKIMNTN
jgi:predicted NUDIX family NTP pyrophosphohydrolase